MLNDHTLLLLARERQEQVRYDVASCRHAAKMLTRAALMSAFFTTTIAVACSGDRPGCGLPCDNGVTQIARHQAQEREGNYSWRRGWPIPSGSASMRTKATRAFSVPRLNQAWFVPRCTITSPVFKCTLESSMSMSISPASTIT
jgi:hypothetical protein